MHLKNFKNLRLRDIDGNHISYKDFLIECRSKINEGYKVYIGSDSQKNGSRISFVTCVCLHNRLKGGFAFYGKQKVDKKFFPSLKSRMMGEMFASLNTSYFIRDELGCDIEIHLDIGSNPIKCRTYKFKKEFMGIVSSQGFSVKVKPQSWASSSIADWFTKT